MKITKYLRINIADSISTKNPADIDIIITCIPLGIVRKALHINKQVGYIKYCILDL